MADDLDAYTTYVFAHKDVAAARALRDELFQRFTFGDDAESPTTICGVMSGDALSVSDAVRMANDCRVIDLYERGEFAAAIGEALTWECCLAVAAEWGLTAKDGDFVSAEQVSA